MAIRGGLNITREFLLEAIVAGNAPPGILQVYIAGDLTALLGARGMYLPDRQKLMISLVDSASLNDRHQVPLMNWGTPCHWHMSLVSRPAIPCLQGAIPSNAFD